MFNEAEEIASLNMGATNQYSFINFLGEFIEGLPSKRTSSLTESFSSESFTLPSREEKSALRDAAAWKLGVGLGVSIPIALISALAVAWTVFHKKKSCRSHPASPHSKEEERKGEGNSCGEFNVTVNL